MATHFTGRFNRSVGLLLGLALLVGLFVAGPATSQTADPAPDYLASFEACPEDVIPDADFADVPGRHENASDINCIAYYGITKGTSATTYSPDRPVIREHMALFLIRLANLVDIYVPPPSATPFTDIADLSQESRDTISQIYELGITIGTSATTYTPGRNVSRGEMALFLRRLMDQMDVVADGRDLYGYLPDDVDDNDLDADIEAPWRDIDDVPFAENEAVTELYELGVASGFGGSSRLYGPNRDMSRADMAAFMASILDHSNLRPKGANIQVSPTRGADDFDITAMISVRSDTFAPQEDQAVDWFYTDDPEGGLERNGECDISTILGNGDCQWDDDDDETDRDGNIFVEVRATAGATMTFYAWIGRRNGDDFDDDSVDHSKAAAQSDKGPSSLLVSHDVPVNAAQTVRDDAWIVDMDRRSSVEFTIQLQDEFGASLEREGVVIDVEVDSRQIVVDAANYASMRPDPDYTDVRRDSSDDQTLVTDRRGEAVFELDGPSRHERLDAVTFRTDCCDERIQIAWSQADPVLVSAKPTFNLYQKRSQNKINFTVGFDLYDQYGNQIRGEDTRYTGRDQDVKETLTYDICTFVPSGTPVDTYTGTCTGSDTPLDDATLNRGRLRAPLRPDDLLTSPNEYLVVIKPNICTTSESTVANQCTEQDSDTDRIHYADDQIVVWIVDDAERRGDYSSSAELVGDHGLTLKEVELYPADNRFRTFFKLWNYDIGDNFQVDGDFVTLQEFEREWQRIGVLVDLAIPVYSSGYKLFVIR